MVRLSPFDGKGVIHCWKYTDSREGGFWHRNNELGREVKDGRWEFDFHTFERGTGNETKGKADTGVSSAPAAPQRYLKRLEAETKWVDVLGISTRDETSRIPLDDVYIRLLTHKPVEADGKHHEQRGGKERVGRNQAIDLARALDAHRFLVVVGAPGSRKTTFLRFAAHHLARRLLGAETCSPSLPFDCGGEPPAPLLVPLRTFAAFVPSLFRSFVAADLPAALEEWAAKDILGFEPGAITRLFEGNRLALLFDGLDEIPDEDGRVRVCQLLAKAASCAAQLDGFGGRMVVTSRPVAYGGATRLPAPFVDGTILELNDEDVERFVEHWVRAVFKVPAGTPLEERADASDERAGLLRALRSSEIRRMSRTPVLLTVMALVCRAHGRLLEQRALVASKLMQWTLATRATDHGDQPPARMYLPSANLRKRSRGKSKAPRNLHASADR